jgi:hypothetical protein
MVQDRFGNITFKLPEEKKIERNNVRTPENIGTALNQRVITDSI